PDRAGDLTLNPLPGTFQLRRRSSCCSRMPSISSSGSMVGPALASTYTIRPVKERVEDALLQRPGVNGVDINEKVTNGRPTGELAIVVYVDEKKPKSRLTKT